MSFTKQQRRLIQEFSSLEDEFDRFTYLTLMGMKLELPQEGLCCDENKVKGCQSDTWVHVTLREDRVALQAYSDTLIVRGLLNMLKAGIDGQLAVRYSYDSCLLFFEEAGLMELLTESRRSGLRSILITVDASIKHQLK